MALKPLLDDLVKTHERIQAAQASADSADKLVDRARSGYLPRVDAIAEGGIEEMTKPHETSTDKWRNVQTLRATQLLYDFGGTSGNVAMYRGIRDEVGARYDQTVQDVIIEGISAYLMVIRAREMLKYAIISEDNVKQITGMQEALVRRGAALSYEELQAKGQLAGAQSHRVTVERALATAKNDFRSLFGFEPDDRQVEVMKEPEVPFNLIPGSLEKALDTAMKDNPQLRELSHSVERTQGDYDARKASYFPKLQLVGESQRKENDQGDSGMRYENRGSVQMTYNLFSGGGDVANVGSARDEITATRKRLQDRRRSVEENVRNAWVDLQTLKKNVELYQNQANITWEFLGLIKKKKAVGGDVNLLDILVGERDYISAISAKVVSDIDVKISAYTLLYQMGQITADMVGK